MNKTRKIFLVLTLVLFFSLCAEIGYAASASGGKRVFWGTVKMIETTQTIENYQVEGYQCTHPGTAIEVKSKKDTGEYLIQNVKTMPRPGGWIFGLYTNASSTVNCVHPDPQIPPVSFPISTITLYGTSL